MGLSIRRELKLREWREAVREFERIISLIEDILKKRVDPFTVDISELLEKMRLLLEKYGDEVLLMDMEALSRIVDLIKEQEEWVQNESLVLGMGPLFALARLRQMSLEEIAEKFCEVWNPIAYRDQMMVSTVLRALDYLDAVRRLPKTLTGVESVDFRLSEETLSNLGLLGEEAFREKLSEFSRKVERLLGEESSIDYWDLVLDDTFEKSLENMILLSYLCSRGEVSLKVNPLTDEIKVVKPGGRGDRFSLALPFNYDIWVRRIAEKKKNRREG